MCTSRLPAKMIVSISVLLLTVTWCDGALLNRTLLESYETNPVVKLFREYLRIDTSHPIEGSINYTQAVEFWKRQAASLELPVSVYEYYSGKPIVVITWEGSDPSLPSIMLNSHMDVVTADETKWKYPPFDAYMDEESNIYGRGAQDMKVLAIQHLESIRRLRVENVTLERTIHMTMVPDEEIGGFEGMRPFVESEDFTALNVGFALDEYKVSTTSSYLLSYADKTPWQIVVTCTGPSGHGSHMPEDTAAGKFRKIIDSFLNYRESQLAIKRADPSRKDGSITSINLTKVSGGLATNVIPASMSATFDMRLAFDNNAVEFNKTVTKWIKDAGGDDCSHYYIRYEDVSPATPLDHSNIYWVAFKRAMDTMCLDVIPTILEGTTDMIRLRSRGIPAFGFHPIIQTEPKLHAVDEYLGVDQLLRGVEIYANVLQEIGNAGTSPDYYLPSSCIASSAAISSSWVSWLRARLREAM